MQGCRRPDNTEGHILMAGDYSRQTSRDGSSFWFCCDPMGHLGDLSKHTVTEHEDGTITVSPSIMMRSRTTWHGYLEHGVWREC
jgi:hypothetical protein